MDADEVLAEMTRILRDTLDDESINLTKATERAQIPKWDSFNYIVFMIALESHYKIKFKASDIESFPNVGAIADKILEVRAG